jgi:hypothetical protein
MVYAPERDRSDLVITEMSVFPPGGYDDLCDSACLARPCRAFRAPGCSDRQEAIQRLTEGATQADLARTYSVSQATISRLQPSPFPGRNRRRMKRGQERAASRIGAARILAYLDLDRRRILPRMWVR